MGERQFRFNAPVKDEFGHLADSFDEMADNVVDSVKDPMSILDKDRKIIYMNEYGLALKNNTLENVVGRLYDSYSIYPNRTKYDPIVALEEGREAEIYYNEKTESYMKGVANYFYSNKGEKIGYIVLSMDVTDMVLRQIELEQAVNDANIANMHKGEFLARMSHEIRTPMNAIIGITNIVLNKLNTKDNAQENLAEIENHVKQIETSSQHLLGLLNDVLDISKIEAGKIEISEGKMDLLKTAQTVEEIIRPRCDEKHIEFIVAFDSFDSAVFMSDQLRLRQVLINLLGNAVKFTPEGGRIEFRVEKKDSRDDKTLVKFTVKDTGIGISDAAKEKIFVPFEQASANISLEYGGTGLGLAISRCIVELLGGEIEIDSEEGKGSVFTFSVWLQKLDETPMLDIKYDDAVGKFKNKRALIVDDIEINRMIVAGLLEDTGIVIEEAEDGQVASDMFLASEEGYYDIIFMDIQMPTMNGYDSTAIIRESGRGDAQSVVIVALTANAFVEDIDKAKMSGMDTHIAKPVDGDKLVEVLFEFLK
jgi:signal transduction histidine kinase/CheY-like chemotaxis protein